MNQTIQSLTEFKLAKSLLFAIALFWGFSGSTTPPSSAGPEEATYYSGNKKFRLHIYFSNHIPNRYEPLASFESKSWWGYTEINRFSSEYHSFPHPQIIVKNDGKYFAMLSEGYQKDFNRIKLAAFRPDGSRVFLYETKDLFPKNIGIFPKWKYPPSFSLSFDETKNLLVMKTWPRDGTLASSEPQCPELLIDLESGKCLTSKSSLAPWFSSWFSFIAGPNLESHKTDGPVEYLCTPNPPIGDYSQAQMIPSAYFLSLAKEHPIPKYPPIAEIAQISGTVVIEFYVSPDGTVQCARIVSGPPQLAYVLRQSVLKWSFNPPKQYETQPHPFRGSIAFTGRLILGEVLD